LTGNELQMGFDTGPGNTLLDHWISRHSGCAYDHDGAWSAGGQANPALLEQLSRHPYFQQEGPRSTGKEAFHLSWLDSNLEEFTGITAQDVQATLVELTSYTIARAVKRCPFEVAEVYVCGGGSHNAHLMQRLTLHMAPATVASTAALGMDPDWVEAATFAWLASQTLNGLAGNSQRVTGAAGGRVLGGVYCGGA
jgi:anhydro-N-acetylmuramic acid kinase